MNAQNICRVFEFAIALFYIVFIVVVESFSYKILHACQRLQSVVGSLLQTYEAMEMV
jgi:hypothetical protein